MIKGFEFWISYGRDTLYISNKCQTGYVSFVVADKQPSLLDVKERNIECRWDITESDFCELVKRLNKEAAKMTPTAGKWKAQVYEAKGAEDEPQGQTDSESI